MPYKNGVNSEVDEDSHPVHSNSRKCPFRSRTSKCPWNPSEPPLNLIFLISLETLIIPLSPSEARDTVRLYNSLSFSS